MVTGGSFVAMMAAMALVISSLAFSGQYGTNVNPAPSNIGLTAATKYTQTYTPETGSVWTPIENATDRLAHGNHRTVFKIDSEAGKHRVDLTDMSITNATAAKFVTFSDDGIYSARSIANKYVIQTITPDLTLQSTTGAVNIIAQSNLVATVAGNSVHSVIGDITTTSQTTTATSVGASAFTSSEGTAVFQGNKSTTLQSTTKAVSILAATDLTAVSRTLTMTSKNAVAVTSTEGTGAFTSNGTNTVSSTVAGVAIVGATGVTATATTGPATVTSTAGTASLAAGSGTPASVAATTAGEVLLTSAAATVIASTGGISANSSAGDIVIHSTVGKTQVLADSGDVVLKSGPPGGNVASLTLQPGGNTRMGTTGMLIVNSGGTQTFTSSTETITLAAGGGRDVVFKTGGTTRVTVADASTTIATAATVTGDLRVGAASSLIVGADARTVKVAANATFFKVVDTVGGATDGSLDATASTANTDMLRILLSNYMWKVRTTANGGASLTPMMQVTYTYSSSMDPEIVWQTGISYSAYTCASVTGWGVTGTITAPSAASARHTRLTHNSVTKNWELRWLHVGLDSDNDDVTIDVMYIISTWCTASAGISGNPTTSAAPTAAPTPAPTGV